MTEAYLIGSCYRKIQKGKIKLLEPHSSNTAARNCITAPFHSKHDRFHRTRRSTLQKCRWKSTINEHHTASEPM